MTRRRRLTLQGLGALGVLAVAAPLAWVGFGVGPEVPVAKVGRGPFVRKITAEGNLKAVDATPLIAPMEAEGQMKIAWLVPDGSRVKEDDVVVRFDPTEMEKQLADGESDRATAESKIEGARASSEGDLENLARDADLARRELEVAGEFEAKDPLIFSRSQIIESEIDRDLASRRVGNADQVREIKTGLSRVGVGLLEIEKRKADLKIRQALKALDALEIRAPHDGIVVYKREWRPTLPKVGDTVWSGFPLGEMPRPEAMEAEVFVLEADAGGLTVGKAAELVVDSRTAHAWRAKVKGVDKLARPRVPWIPVQYFRATLELERTDPEAMKPGQRVSATLLLDERPDALTVPRSAVFEKDGKKVVYRRDGNRFVPVEIETGPMALGRFVVEKGLAEGDRVALQDPTRPVGEEPAGTGGAKPAVPARPAAGGPG